MPSSLKRPPTGIDSLFKHTIIISTALSMAVMYGWLEGFERQPDGGFHFHWRWLQLVWAAIGYLSTAYFWHKAWPAANHVHATRKDIFKGAVVFGLPCLWWLTLPLRFDSGQHLKDVLSGLIAAVIVLSIVAWMLFRLFKAFEETDKYGLESLDKKSGSESNKNGGPRPTIPE